MPGFEAKFKHPLLKQHECPICLFAMCHPVQTECGHLFCRDCLEPVLKRRHPICPLDKEEITQEGTFPDNACRREILKLQVFCNFQNCPWIGALKDLEAHLGNCDYRDVQCTQCGQYIQQLYMEAHQKELCAMRPTTCPHCSKDVPTQQLQTHFDKLCTKITRGCPNECDPSLKMNLQELEKHTDLKKGTCPLSEVACPYEQDGCSFISLRQNLDMATHLDQYRVYHTQIRAESFKEYQQLTIKLNLSFNHLLERVGSLATRSNALERLQDALEQRIEFLDDRRDNHAAITIDSIQEQATPNTAFNPTQAPITPNYQLQGFDVPPQFVELEHSVDRALSSCLDQELRIQLLERTTHNGVLLWKTDRRRRDAIYNGVLHNEVDGQRREASVRLSLYSTPFQANHNGVLLWKIDEFYRRRREAVDGVTLSLYSTPFYTSRHGYKMCARVYLNGDGMGKGSHLSFFSVIMRGPFDASLQWPFKQKVTLSLINQNGKKHISDSFRPDPHSNSFQKPGRREINIASGCPRFIRIDHLLNGGFVKDDAIYVRVVVETMDLPKIIPRVCGMLALKI